MASCFVVLGTLRSGTSLAAGILHNLGIPMGIRIDDANDPDRWDFPGADEGNPKGYFEDAEFINFGFDVLGWPLPDANVSLTDKQREKLAEMISYRSKAGCDWGVKAHAMPWYLNDFLDLCPSRKIVVCRRDKTQSVASWAAMSKCADAEATRVIGVASRSLNSIVGDIELNFDNLANWQKQLAEFCGRELNQSATDFPNPDLVRF
jgi:hypothetical protein